MRDWLKKSWGWLVAAAAAIVGAIIFVLSFGRVKPRPRIEVPKLPEVKIPTPPPVNTTPADDYQRDKTPPKTNGDDVADDINRRYR